MKLTCSREIVKVRLAMKVWGLLDAGATSRYLRYQGNCVDVGGSECVDELNPDLEISDDGNREESIKEMIMESLVQSQARTHFIWKYTFEYASQISTQTCMRTSAQYLIAQIFARPEVRVRLSCMFCFWPCLSFLHRFPTTRCRCSSLLL